MSNFDMDDSLTNLNTQLNKSMVLMDTTETEIRQPKSKKSIKINTKVQPYGSFNTTPVSRKSILKKTETKSTEVVQNAETNAEILNDTNNSRTSVNVLSSTKPQNIKDLIQEENLIVQTIDSTLNLEDLYDNEDIWIMDIPRTIDPKEFKGQTLTFGEKSNLKVGEEKYCAINHENKCNVTCVFKTDKKESKYKTVTIKPAGTITVRRKLSNASKIKPMQVESHSMLFPENLRTRHPFGVSYEGNVKEV